MAASFIRTAENVRSVIAFLERCIAALPENHFPGDKKPLRPLVISKIESKEGVDNFDAILEESDGIMVARGDVSIFLVLRQLDLISPRSHDYRTYCFGPSSGWKFPLAKSLQHNA